MSFVLPPFSKVEYLLTDPGKIKFFTILGYRLSAFERLQNDILNAAQAAQVVRLRQTTVYGQEYEILGDLDTPVGRKTRITMSWFLDDGESEKLRFVTAYANP